MRCWEGCEIMHVQRLCLDTQWSGVSALMMAAREGRTKVVSLLLEAGANTDLQNKVKGKVVSTYRIVLFPDPALMR